MLDHLERRQSLPSNPHLGPNSYEHIVNSQQQETVVGALPVDPDQIALEAAAYAMSQGGWDQKTIEEFGSGNWSALVKKASGPELASVDDAAESGQQQHVNL